MKWKKTEGGETGKLNRNTCTIEEEPKQEKSEGQRRAKKKRQRRKKTKVTEDLQHFPT